jgi:hypothetical protein
VAVELAEATDAKANEDARRVYRNAAMEAWGLQTEASMARQQAARTKKRGRYDAMTTLFGGAVKGGESFVGTGGLAAMGVG